MLLVAAPAFALSSDPLGFEGGDANQVVDTPGASDWQNVGQLTGSLQSVVDGTGASDDVYQAGSENSPETWKVGPGSAATKADLVNFWAAAHPATTTTTQSPSPFLYLGFQRGLNTDPNAGLEFEINQSRATWTNPAGATIPCRTNGDLLVSYAVSPSGSGPSQATLTVYRWQSTASGNAACPGGTGTWGTGASVGAGEFEGAMNSNAPVGNCLASADCSQQLAAGTFGEAAIDLNDLLRSAGVPQDDCFMFVQAQVRSRSAGSTINSSLVDYVAPIQFTLPLQGCSAPPPDDQNPSISHVNAAGTGVTGQVHVDWTPAYHGDSPLTGYTLTVTGPNGAQQGSPLSLGATTTSATINGLTNGTTYTFTVTARNQNGRTGSKSATAVPFAGGSANGPGEQQLLGERFANLPEDCVTGPFSVKLLRAKGFNKLVIYVDGHKRRMLKKRLRASTKTIRIDASKLKAGRHKVVVRMFRPRHKKASRTARFTFMRCSTACVRGKRLALGRLPKPMGSTIQSAVIRVSGRRKAVRVAGAKARRRVTVPMPAKGSKIRVRITVTTTDGRVKTYRRVYTRCGQRAGTKKHRHH